MTVYWCDECEVFVFDDEVTVDADDHVCCLTCGEEVIITYTHDLDDDEHDKWEAAKAEHDAAKETT